jgi:hypothetical protein
MLKVFLIFALIVSAGIFHWIVNRRLTGRIRALEQNLQHFSDVVTQMAEVQMKTFQKHTANFEDLEERIMELSVPSHDSSMPLERRHQVLALSRQGVGLDEIVKRLKAPVGEAELILNLQKYMGGENSRSAKINEQVRKYA